MEIILLCVVYKPLMYKRILMMGVLYRSWAMK